MTEQKTVPFSDTEAGIVAPATSKACKRIMASWPLDYWVATSPWWQWQDQPVRSATARLATLANVRGLMPAFWYRSAWDKGVLQRRHLERAIDAAEGGAPLCVDELLDTVAGADAHSGPSFLTVPALLDRQSDRQSPILWQLEVTDQISHFMAQWTRAHSRADGTLPEGAETHLYADWLAALRRDRGLIWRTGQRWLRASVHNLPESGEQAIQDAFATLGIRSADIGESICTALLMGLHGWASRVAWTDWQARLSGAAFGTELVRAVLAVRLAWEAMLYEGLPALAGSQASGLRAQWHQQCFDLPHLLHQSVQHARPLWLWQRALELAYNDRLENKLLSSPPITPQQPAIQAVFCIDVRSEPMRRALEAQSNAIQTVGFAGFFGLPLAIRDAGAGAARASVPGLLAPSLTVNTGSEASRPDWHKSVSQGALTALGYVETAGLSYVRSLWAGRRKPANVPGHSEASHAISWRDGRPVLYDDMATICRQSLQGMGLSSGLARTVLLVGHGGESANNPMASSLHCGACGGHTGESHVRILCSWLNKPAVRSRLARLGLDIPEETVFLPALHNTTRETVRLLDTEQPRAAAVRDLLNNASVQARSERIKKDPETAGRRTEHPEEALAIRATDWSEVRPEWGLAGNAAVIMAPRSWTRGVDLEGRVFLHDYEWQNDPDYQWLTQLMTAPLLVTHWINMQYYSSVTDPVVFGSGDKTLHNVVSGNQGVFEGNGGDLRTGLPLQSVHYGENWVHEPLRLTAYIAAPPSVIRRIIRSHETLTNLVRHEWLWVKAWNPSGADFTPVSI